MQLIGGGHYLKESPSYKKKSTMNNETKPEKIRLEASSLCQLRCVSCPMPYKENHRLIGYGYLKIDDFKKLVDENPWIREIELSNYGEIFLNPDLLDIIKYAYIKKVTLTAYNGANLNTANEEILEALVKYSFRGINCSIDGASNETYKRYRVRGDFDRVIENIKRINYYKEKYNSRFPLLSWQFVIFGHNEHEIPEAIKMAKDLDMRFLPELTWDESFSPIRDKEFVKEQTGLDVTSRAEYYQEHETDYTQGICYQLWNSPQINWDGKLLGCCRNYWGSFGNAFESGLLNALNNENMKYAREMLLGKKPAREDIPCATCRMYEGMKAAHRWLTPQELQNLRTPHVAGIRKSWNRIRYFIHDNILRR